MSAPTTYDTDDTNEARFLAPKTHQRSGQARRTAKQREDACSRRPRELETRAKYGEVDVITSSAAARKLLQMRLGHLEHEEFHCMWLNAQHRLLAIDSLFRGALAESSVSRARS